MKISELVERTGVPKETIHYYIREGVLRKPRKKGRNKADYNESYVEQIRIIKRLQDNYFLPLSVIKKVIKQHKKQSRSEQSSFQFLSEHFRPLDLLLSNEVVGKEAFWEAAGLGRKYIDLYQNWDVITVEERDGLPVYSKDDVIIGKLIAGMGRLGFVPRNGANPEDLKQIADFVREYVTASQKAYYQSNLEKLSQDEFEEKGSEFTEIMSLFFYYLYRKIFREVYNRLQKNHKNGDSERE